MKRLYRATRLARFDIEPLLSAILRNGLLMSMGLIMAGLVAQWVEPGQTSFGPNLQAKSIPLLILNDIRGLDSPKIWYRLLTDLGVAGLMLTPYVRLVASMMYFAWVERSRKHVLFTGFVLTILTVVLLTRIV